MIKIEEQKLDKIFTNKDEYQKFHKYCVDNIYEKYEQETEEYYNGRDYTYISFKKNILIIECKKYAMSKRAYNPNWFCTGIHNYEIDLTNIKDKVNSYHMNLELEKFKKEKEKYENEIQHLKNEIKDIKYQTNENRSYENNKKCTHETWSDGSRKYKLGEVNDYGYVVGSGGKWIDPYKSDESSW